MKRVVTALFSLIFLAGITSISSAQVAQHREVHTNSASPSVSILAGHSLPGTLNSPLEGNNSIPLLNLTTDVVSYFQDTTGDNWWLHYPLFDSIGPITIGLGGGADTTALDTMYYRVMALRVSVPTDLKPYPAQRFLDSASITVFAQALNPADVLEFWVVPIEDVQFTRQGTPIGTYPIPDLFANSTNGSYIAKASIPASAFTVGQLNTVTVKFGHKPLLNKTQFGICVFVDGPNFALDTIGYQFDANLGDYQGANLEIDTDGSISGIPMRTYQGELDAGHLVLGGGTQPSYVGTISSFFADIQTVDQNGAPTGQSFNGNLVMNTYISGTALLGVNNQAANGYNLETCYPNPVVSTSAEIPYNLGNSGPATLKIYNSIGEEVATVINGFQAAGPHSVTFNTSNLPNGMYYYKLQSGEYTATQGMVVNK